jgi:hypothetical protein
VSLYRDNKTTAPRMVIHRDGGYLMRVECTEGTNAVCSWEEWPDDWTPGDPRQPRIYRRMFPIVCLGRITPFIP